MLKIYSKVIKSFNIFKDIDNSYFILQVLTSFIPIISKKEEILILEGELIDNIIFVKDGRLSLEVSIDLSDPYKYIQNYLHNNFIGISRKQEINNNNINRVNSILEKKSQNYKDLKNLIDNLLLDNQKSITQVNSIDDNGISMDLGRLNFSRNSIEETNIKAIKILDIRKNEHFGDVLMFLNKKSPLFVRVRSNKADLLLLKKLDALKISNNYPSIWKKIIKKPLSNSKLIQNLTLKMLVTFCNYYGIKTNLFKKLNRNKEYPSYYLKPILNLDNSASKIKKKSKITSLIDMKKTEESDELNSELINENKLEKNDIIYKESKTFPILKDNSKKDNSLINEINDSIKTTKTTKNNSSSLLYRNINGKINKNNSLVKKSLSSDKNKKKVKFLEYDNKNNNNNNINLTQSFSFKNKNNVNNSEL